MLPFRLIFVDEAAGWRLVGDRPTEIHLGINDLISSHCEDLSIAKAVTAGAPSLVGDKNLVTFCDEMDEIEPLGPLAIRPAACEIGCAIEPVIDRAGKMEILGQ